MALPVVYPWPRGSRPGIPTLTAVVDREPANTQPSALRYERGKPRPLWRGGGHWDSCLRTVPTDLRLRYFAHRFFSQFLDIIGPQVYIEPDVSIRMC